MFCPGSICADARQFVLPREPIVIYLFNPFPEWAFKDLIVKIEGSFRHDAHPVYVLYHNPLLEHVLAQSPLLRKIGGSHQYALYASRD